MHERNLFIGVCSVSVHCWTDVFEASAIPCVIPDSVTEIGESAFEDCSSLTSVEIPEDCKVSDDAFPKTVKIIKVK